MDDLDLILKDIYSKYENVIEKPVTAKETLEIETVSLNDTNSISNSFEDDIEKIKLEIDGFSDEEPNEEINEKTTEEPNEEPDETFNEETNNSNNEDLICKKCNLPKCNDCIDDEKRSLINSFNIFDEFNNQQKSTNKKLSNDQIIAQCIKNLSEHNRPTAKLAVQHTLKFAKLLKINNLSKSSTFFCIGKENNNSFLYIFDKDWIDEKDFYSNSFNRIPVLKAKYQLLAKGKQSSKFNEINWYNNKKEKQSSKNRGDNFKINDELINFLRNNIKLKIKYKNDKQNYFKNQKLRSKNADLIYVYIGEMIKSINKILDDNYVPEILKYIDKNFTIIKFDFGKNRNNESIYGIFVLYDYQTNELTNINETTNQLHLLFESETLSFNDLKKEYINYLDVIEEKKKKREQQEKIKEQEKRKEMNIKKDDEMNTKMNSEMESETNDMIEKLMDEIRLNGYEKISEDIEAIRLTYQKQVEFINVDINKILDTEMEQILIKHHQYLYKKFMINNNKTNLGVLYESFCFIKKKIFKKCDEYYGEMIDNFMNILKQENNDKKNIKYFTINKETNKLEVNIIYIYKNEFKEKIRKFICQSIKEELEI